MVHEAPPGAQAGADDGGLPEPEWLLLRAGDPAAQERLYRRYADPLYRALRAWARWLTPEEAEEVLGEAFVRVLRGLANVRDPAALEGWLFTVARNALTDRARRRGRELRVLSFDALSPAARSEVLGRVRSEGEPAGSVLERLAEREDREQLGALVDQVLAELPLKHQEILRAKFQDGMGRAQLAARLGISPEAAAALLYRAKAAFRAAFRKRAVNVR
ncbi:MAG: sigma-70 family RNA polymerase sigma factor [Planctomycetota bacterium]|nr:sigma-70 family RNA polymerase sigma factor [Planctomycetota bacterium]